MKTKLIYFFLALSFAFNVLLIKKHVVYFHGKSIANLYAKHVTPMSSKYKADKKLIEPYFDEEFYKLNYEENLKCTGLAPIDHFLQRGYKGEWQNHCDPNNWFNVTLYQERLWPCKGNPFVDFLRQPASTVKADAKKVEIFVKNENELYRAWIAAEGFLRQNLHKVTINLSPSNFKDIPICFKPMMARGLHVLIENKEGVSFYKSNFLKNPKQFDINIFYEKETFMPMKHVIKDEIYQYIMHSFYSYHNYGNRGKIEPLMLNYGNYTDEPLWSFPFAQSEGGYKQYMKRISPGYDLIFTGVAVDVPNERTVPGFMCTFMDDKEVKEITASKTYGVSFLLSLGHKAGNESYRANKTENYYMREFLWKEKDAIKIPKQFYVSKSGIENYTAEYQSYVMPTRSKKWILNSQFNIAIENCKQHNYFTEKIISCFTSLVVPIYIGCPNITDYFDKRGMFIANDIEDAIKICNSITPETYKKMLPYVIENKKRAESLLVLKDKYINQFYEENMP